eukprot:g14698.t1
MLYKAVSEPPLGLTAVEEATSGAADVQVNIYKGGVAMGTHMGRSYACLFIEYMEQSLFRCYTGTIPHLFLRYIDDWIGGTSCSHKELEQFINFTNTFHPN